MKIRAQYRLAGCVTALLLAGCAAKQGSPAADGKLTPQMRSGSTELRGYQIADWTAPDDRTLIINAVDRSLYQARFSATCTGLRSVDTIAFVVQGTPQVDRFSGVVLPDGTPCPFKSITRLATPDPQARDNNR